ncbi:hypothetical protein FRX31_032986 [Thalictrum thalictroides]|uniref:Uncharacterized protein n=1 Tax=Thalictrum thalictroides TaxID=46969 RepID=A0A7J6UXT3_THATH|nr:hypothetical protein FRX31_032986 [Thalictrum thalictroides]
MEIKSIIEDGLNYKNLTKIHSYVAGRLLDTLRLVVDDNNTMDMMNVSKVVICLYLEHEYDYINAHDVLDLAESSQPFGEDNFLGESSQALGEESSDNEDNDVYEEDDIFSCDIASNDSGSEAKSIDVSDDELRKVRVEQMEENKAKKKMTTRKSPIVDSEEEQFY